MTKTERQQKILDMIGRDGENQPCTSGRKFDCKMPASGAHGNIEAWCDNCLHAELAGAKISEPEERASVLEDLFYEGAGKVHEGSMVGWWDSCAKRSIKDAGDELVGLGKFERHADGVGRRWFYRRIKKPEDAS